MGMLSYFVREDGTGERFALNKVDAYLRDGFREYGSVAPLPSAEEIKSHWLIDGFGDWSDRVASRLVAWAGGSPVRLTSEYEDEPGGDGQITGSSYDNDYEADGTTYRPGSAW